MMNCQITHAKMIPPLYKWVLAGFLIGISLLFPFLWPLGILGLLLELQLLLKHTGNTFSLWRNAFYASTLQMLVVQLWYWEVVPLTPLNISGFEQTIIIVFVWLTSSILIGAGQAAGICLIRSIAKSQIFILALYPIGILSGEILGRVLSSIFFIGPDSGVGAWYGFGHLGYTLVEHNIFRYAAIFGGVYTLTLVAAVLAVIIFVVLKHQPPKWLGFMLLFSLYISSFAPVAFQTDSKLADNIALVSTYFTMDLNTSAIGPAVMASAHKQALDEILSGGYNTAVFPEDSRVLMNMGEIERIYYKQQIREQDLLLIESSYAEHSGQAVLRGIIFDGNDGNTYTYDKEYLVPFGEQIPFVADTFLYLIGMSNVVMSFNESFTYHTGVAFSASGLPHNMPVILFCYEAIVPYLAQQRSSETTPYFAHLVSHAWFNDRLGILQHQLSAMLRVKALGSNVPIVQAGNIAPAAVYTTDGEAYMAPALPSGQLWGVTSVADILNGE